MADRSPLQYVLLPPRTPDRTADAGPADLLRIDVREWLETAASALPWTFQQANRQDEAPLPEKTPASPSKKTSDPRDSARWLLSVVLAHEEGGQQAALLHELVIDKDPVRLAVALQR